MTYPAMTYRAAHKWESYAAAHGISKVARSERGFMRALQKAGSVGRLSDYWKNRRNGFIARHMAQVHANGERLWKHDAAGVLVPSRRCVALMMWAFMPPMRNPPTANRGCRADTGMPATIKQIKASMKRCGYAFVKRDNSSRSEAVYLYFHHPVLGADRKLRLADHAPVHSRSHEADKWIGVACPWHRLDEIANELLWEDLEREARWQGPYHGA